MKYIDPNLYTIQLAKYENMHLIAIYNQYLLCSYMGYYIHKQFSRIFSIHYLIHSINFIIIYEILITFLQFIFVFNLNVNFRIAQ